jgi:hypothetical protein
VNAAKLPGEAEDYIEVFRAGLPALVDAMPGARVEDIAAFTNRLTAIGTSVLQVDAAQLGRDLQLMVGPIGRAGAQVRTFAQLLGFLRKLPGQANLTAEAFNRLSQPQRLKMLQDVLGNKNLSDALDHSADSFDAMWGAAVSGAKQFVREASKGAFKQMKVALQEITSLFIDDKGNLTKFGQGIADTGKMVLGWIGQILAAGGGLLKWLATSEHGARIFKVALGGLGVVLAGLVASKTISGLGKIVSLLTSPKLLLMGIVAALIGLAAEDLYQFLTGGESVIGLLKNKFPEAWERTARGFRVMIDFVKQVVAGFGVMVDMGKQVFDGFGVMFDAVAQTAAGFGVMADQIERAAAALKEFLGLNNPQESDTFKKLADSSFDRSVGVNDNAGEPTFLQQPVSMTGASAGAAGGTSISRVVNNNTRVDRPHIEIKTSDPDRAGEAAARHLTRNAQKQYR